jgi:hypothetical protein
MTQKIEVSSGNIGFCGLLTILFIGLKLGGVIAWSWWWVLSPLWIPLALVVGIAAVCLLIAGIVALIAGAAAASTKRKMEKRRREASKRKRS